jgi:hypothetical protein
MSLYDEFIALLAALDEAQVEYATVGALAVGIWGAPRATKDIDLLVLEADLARAKSAASSCGFRLEALPISFQHGSERHRVSKLVERSPLMVDFLLARDHLLPVWQSRSRRGLDDARTVSVVSRDALIAMKLSAGRPQDLVDVAKLQEIGS